MYGRTYGDFDVWIWKYSSFNDFWMKSIPMNFILALPYQILIAGPIVRTLFQRIVKKGKNSEHKLSSTEKKAT